MEVGAVQMAMSGNRDADIEKTMHLVRQAAQQGAKIVLPPELFEEGEAAPAPVANWQAALASEIASRLGHGEHRVLDEITPALRISSRICSKNRLGVPERRAISSIVSGSGAGFAASSARTSRAFNAYFIFCVIMNKP